MGIYRDWLLGEPSWVHYRLQDEEWGEFGRSRGWADGKLMISIIFQAEKISFQSLCQNRGFASASLNSAWIELSSTGEYCSTAVQPQHPQTDPTHLSSTKKFKTSLDSTKKQCISNCGDHHNILAKPWKKQYFFPSNSFATSTYQNGHIKAS